jgi:rhamnose utilization protein RhaD (predicted bifunctional aldolase and dehydrogenase)/NAD(P)-dependent dehydrogenase (short-subunit alcohol dehydrogenase family)
VKSLWNDADAAQHADDLSLRVYTSRLLGRDSSLVLHSGGNTSVKAMHTNLFGEDEPVLLVKGSGGDLATITAAGFAPVRLVPLLRLSQLDALSDAQMVNELRCALTDAAAPTPSVEAILHAIIPGRFVDHSHADALIALMNAPGGEARVREQYGDSVAFIPYVMPGFALARLVAQLLPEQIHPGMVGMVLLKHGLFTWGETARESYERHVALVTMVEEVLGRDEGRGMRDESDAGPLGSTGAVVDDPRRAHRAQRAERGEQVVKASAEAGAMRRVLLAELRRDMSYVAGFPLIVSSHDDPQALDFARRPDLPELATGPATPDHVIRTKRLPLIGRDVAGYAAAYRQYFETQLVERQTANSTPHPASRIPHPLRMLDPAPRIVLDPELGMLAAGRTAQEAAIAEEIYRHTISMITQAAALGGWEPLPAKDLFDVEYWELEQAKLLRSGAPLLFAGEVVLVTGAASGIGRACAESFRARGAAVVALDINPAVHELAQRGTLSLTCDITDVAAIASAFEAAARRFGGLDMLVLNAGIFPRSTKVADLADADWMRVMRVNLDANLTLLREAHPLLRLAPRGGRVVVIGSKNVPAPGPGAAAYSAAKAALTQLARVSALEWGADGIRVNVLHPNAVFDTGIWTEEVLRARAASYGLTVEQYKTNNVLQVEVTSRDVAELAAELCGPLFAKTTGAQIPVDGGNERVI